MRPLWKKLNNLVKALSGEDDILTGTFKNADNQTILHLAVRHGWTSVVEDILKVRLGDGMSSSFLVSL